MRDYFLALLTTSVIGAVCTVLAWGGFEKYIKYIASLVCILLIVSPLKSISISEITESGEISIYSGDDFSSLSAELTKEQVELFISDRVFSEFGIKPIYTDIFIDWAESVPTVKSITLALNAADMPQKEKIESYLKQHFGGTVRAIEG